MACEMQSSPPVPAPIMKNKKMSSSTLVFLRGSRVGVPDNDNPEANDGDAGPADQVHGFVKKKKSKKGHNGIRKGGRRLDITVIRPSEDQHVGDKKSQQARDAHPNVA